MSQSDDDASRFLHLKGLKNKVLTTGNLKYDQNPVSAENPAINELMAAFCPEHNTVFAAGCTHPEEEPAILQGFKAAKEIISGMKIIIAPRHLEQISLARQNIENAGLKYAVWPDMPISDIAASKADALLINKTGVLQAIYRHAEVCFVGGTLDKTGGHNLLEPALFGKPVLFGPNYRTARVAGNALVKNSGGFIVKNEEEIAAMLEKLCGNEKALAEASANSAKTLKELQGATERTLKEIIS